MKKELIYLGFMVSQNDFRMDPKKIKEIIHFPDTRNVFGVEIFRALVCFYRNFIKDFNIIYAPIVQTIKGNNNPFKWIVTTDGNFNLLKQKVIEQHVLDIIALKKFF